MKKTTSAGIPVVEPLPIVLEPSNISQGVLKVNTPFMRADGDPLIIYLAKPEGSQSWVLSDGCSMLRDISGTGLGMRPGMIQQLIRSYGLALSETMMVFESSDKPLQERVLRFVQCMSAIDGILRMWGLTSPVRLNAPKEGEESGYAGTELAAQSISSEQDPESGGTGPRRGKTAGVKRQSAKLRARK